MLRLTFWFLFLIFIFQSPVYANIPVNDLRQEMDKITGPLQSTGIYRNFLSEHKKQFLEADEKNPLPEVVVDRHLVQVESEKYSIGMGFRSVYIQADPKIVVEIANNPQYFQSLYGLDKSAEIEKPSADGSYQARVFKIIPGIENQDYILNYTSRWEDGVWIQRAKLVKDERQFALRDNIKFIESKGSGTIFRELSLFFPLRWWVRLFEGKVLSITARELTKLNISIKCAAEKVQQGTPMSDLVAKACYKEANR